MKRVESVKDYMSTSWNITQVRVLGPASTAQSAAESAGAMLQISASRLYATQLLVSAQFNMESLHMFDPELQLVRTTW